VQKDKPGKLPECSILEASIRRQENFLGPENCQNG